jgi:hypothetical protein
MYDIKINTDLWRTPYLADAETGKRVVFTPLRVEGRGWTVAKRVGSKRTGRTESVAEGFEGMEGYTLAQAQVAANNMQRDTFMRVVGARIDALKLEQRGGEHGRE